MKATAQEARAPGRPLNIEAFLLEVADAVNTTLDLDTLLHRVAELIRTPTGYDVFAILLLNEKTQELRVRFHYGHPDEVAERLRIKVGTGVTGRAAERREAVLVNDVASVPDYIDTGVGVRSELAVPLIVKNRLIGIIDVASRRPRAFTDEHRRLLTVVASRIAVAIENARLYTRVARQAKSLALLFDIGRELTSILDLDHLLKVVADRVAGIIDYQMFSILLVDDARTKLQHRFSLRFNESIQLKHDIPLDRGLVGWAATHKQAVLAPDVTKDARYIPLNPETRSELCVPLVYKGEAIGVLDLEHTRKGFFTEDHVRTISTLAAQVAIAIENARLYERVSREEQRLERDLSMARQLQMHLLPSMAPVLVNAEMAARFAPARAIGGDLYDFIPYSRGRIAIAVGDVSGKGAPAAIYAALVSGFLRSHSPSEPCSPEMLTLINRSLIGRPIEAQFVSMVFAVWSDKSRKIQIANSGLPRPIHCRDGNVTTIEATGLPLGLFPEVSYEPIDMQAKAGDVFVFFSDGPIDAANAKGELFGRAGIIDAVTRTCRRSAEEIADAIFNGAAEHAGGAEAFDDQTIVVLKVL